MSEDREEQLLQMAQAATAGLLDRCRADDGASYLDPTLARQALAACLASIIEPDGNVVTQGNIRQACDDTGKALKAQVKALRRHFEETGEHSGWDARSANVH